MSDTYDFVILINETIHGLSVGGGYCSRERAICKRLTVPVAD